MQVVFDSQWSAHTQDKSILYFSLKNETENPSTISAALNSPLKFYSNSATFAEPFTGTHKTVAMIREIKTDAVEVSREARHLI